MVAPLAHTVLVRLADPTTTWEQAEALMAQLDGAEIESLLEVFGWLHDASDEADLYAAVRVLARWSDRPVARALPPALRAMLAEPDVGDLNKLAAADLLAELGEPVPPTELLAQLRDPTAVARSAVASVLARTDEPFAVINFLDALGRQPPDLVEALIADLVDLDDPRAVLMLDPLTQLADPDLALSAIAAIDELQLTGAAETLALVAAEHPDAAVRDQADSTLRRLTDHIWPAAATNGRADAVESPARAYLTTLDERGGQFVLLTRPSRHAADGLGVLTVYHTDSDGVVQYVASEGATPADFEGLRARLAEAGHTLVAVTAGAAAWELDAASARTLAAGGARAVGYAVWPQVLGPVAREPALDEAAASRPLAETPRLLEHPAFRDWGLDPDRHGVPRAEAADPIAVVRALVDDADALRWARRLRRQAWLLRQLSDVAAADLAVAAAAGLEPPDGVAPEEHPLLLAMAVRRLAPPAG